jgi:hypothetical protein
MGLSRPTGLIRDDRVSGDGPHFFGPSEPTPFRRPQATGGGFGNGVRALVCIDTHHETTFCLKHDIACNIIT